MGAKNHTVTQQRCTHGSNLWVPKIFSTPVSSRYAGAPSAVLSDPGRGAPEPAGTSARWSLPPCVRYQACLVDPDFSED